MAKKTKKNAPEYTTKLEINGPIGFGWEQPIYDSRWLQKQLKGKKNVNIFLSSGGGSIIEANDMFNILQEHPYNVRIEMGGIAASAAGYLFLAGDERAVHKNSVWMSHRAGGCMCGDADDMKAEAHILEGLEQIISNTIAEETGKKQAEVLADMKKETWLFGANQIIEYGLATEIIDAEEEDAPEFTPADEPSNRLKATQTQENMYKHFLENRENYRQRVNEFSNFLNKQEIEEPQTPSNGVKSMTPEEKTAAQNEGIAAERARNSAWLKFNDIDPEYVQKGIESGKEMNNEDFAHFNRVNMDATAKKVLENNSPEPVEPAETEIPEENPAAPANDMTEAERNWLAKYQNKDGK